MFPNFAPAIFVNAFWFSITLLGFTAFVFLYKSKWVSRSLRIAAEGLLRQHFIVLSFFSTVLGFALFAPISFIFYLIHAPVKLLVIGYVLLIIASTIYLLRVFYRKLLRLREYDIFKLSRQTLLVKIIFIFFISVLITDFLLAQFLRSHALLDTDTYYHMTRILEMSSSGNFSIHSGYFSGVMDASYHANLIYFLYTVPVRIFNMEPLTVWSFSFGYFRLIQWMSIFTLAFMVCGWWRGVKSNQLLYASLATTLAISLFAAHFYIAPYPNQIVIVWLTALVLVMRRYSLDQSGESIFAALAISILITATHPTYALIAAMFLTCTAVIIFISSNGTLKKRLHKSYVYLFLVPILMISPLVTKFFPSNITNTQLNLSTTPTLNFLGFSMLNPSSLFDGGLISLVVFIVGCLGAVYLILRVKDIGNSKHIILSVILFPVFTLYTPIVFSLLKIILPVWVLDRFLAMNVFTFILPFFGLLGGMQAIFKIMNTFHKSRYLASSMLHSNVLVLVVLIFSLVASTVSYAQLLHYNDMNQYVYSYTNHIYTELGPVVPAGKRTLSTPLLSYTIPAVLPVNVIAVMEGHSTTMADTQNRIKCQDYMLNNMDAPSLSATGVDFVILPTYDPEFTTRKNIAEKRVYLTRAYKSADYIVYKYDETRSPKSTSNKKPYGPCLDYQVRESTQ